MTSEKLGLTSETAFEKNKLEITRLARLMREDLGDIEIWRQTDMAYVRDVVEHQCPGMPRTMHLLMAGGFAVIATVAAHELELELLRNASEMTSIEVSMHAKKVSRLTTVVACASHEALDCWTERLSGKALVKESLKTQAYIDGQVKKEIAEHDAKSRELSVVAGRRGKEIRLQKFDAIKRKVQELYPSMRKKSRSRTARDICDQLLHNSPPVVIAPRTVEKYIKAIEAELSKNSAHFRG